MLVVDLSKTRGVLILLLFNILYECATQGIYTHYISWEYFRISADPAQN